MLHILLRSLQGVSILIAIVMQPTLVDACQDDVCPKARVAQQEILCNFVAIVRGELSRLAAMRHLSHRPKPSQSGEVLDVPGRQPASKQKHSHVARSLRLQDQAHLHATAYRQMEYQDPFWMLVYFSSLWLRSFGTHFSSLLRTALLRDLLRRSPNLL
jgi:hypothetical protein